MHYHRRLYYFNTIHHLGSGHVLGTLRYRVGSKFILTLFHNLYI